MADRATAKILLEATGNQSPVAPLTSSMPGFDLAAAYGVAGDIIRLRDSAGERQAGWKIGFTNRNIWDEYGVHAPIWGAMYDTTVREVAAGTKVAIDHLLEPRIEPEIAFRFCRAPREGMDETALLGCIDGVCHGFEIVHSIYPDWKFQAPDTVAAFAMHGLFLHGRIAEVEDRATWLRRLENFEVSLLCGGQNIDSGRSADVLGGPLTALRHMVDGLGASGLPRGIEPGDLVTTGTVTRAFPIKSGERWSTAIDGLPLAGLDVTFSD